ncbi:hypothetical protein ACT17_11620 [Mycolicibacterium conceptionense]|jgi:transcriptional regulator with XRE-family HTH domain|uniref:HTH cro/C1-type domain-containing protein n=1 Tax=Mycolicibacterium conceptionense TaxID=451644 RepID=A0A0J8UA65_9MYCO|nr:hypothetical protein [Mycolicibacterium conceptionense]KMV18281.1 hypothetical protein ACT17_11620 [Mycolicibacterium conceptionense]
MLWEKLGTSVRWRRAELGLSQAQVRDRGGPSVETVRALENNRAGRLSALKRRELEGALEWPTGAVDEILAGRTPIARHPANPASAERFVTARQVLSFKKVLDAVSDRIEPDALEVLQAEITRAARESEQAIAALMPSLNDDERGEAIALLAELRS